MREEPGKESRIDAAFFFGSSAVAGTPEADRELETDVRAGRVVRRGRAGRRRAAPGAIVSPPSELQIAYGKSSRHQLHTYSASCQAGCHCEMRGDDVELSLRS